MSATTTAGTAPADQAVAATVGRRLLTGPAQGWASFLLLLVMLAATGLAVDGSHWMGDGPGGGNLTARLPLLMVVAGVVGSLLSWTRLSIGLVDLLAAIAGTAAGLLLAADAISTDASIVGRLQGLDDSLARFLDDVLVRGVQSSEPSAFLLVISALAWTSGVFAAVSIFRRSDPSGAIAAVGAIMLLDALATHRPQDLWLVVFTAASLLLMLRLDLEAQRERWVRHRMGGGQGVGRLFLRGGGVIVALMVGGSIILTSVVSAASLAQAFPQLDDLVVRLANQVGGAVGLPGTPQGASNGVFQDQRRVSDSWITSDAPVFTVRTEDGHYWRATTYDTFDGFTWTRSPGTTQTVATGEDLLGTSVDGAGVEGGVGRAEVSATITSTSLDARWLPAPQDPSAMSIDARVTRLGGDEGTFQSLGAVSSLGRDAWYQVTAWEPVTAPGSLQLTVSDVLRDAGDEYPAWLQPFLALPPDGVGDRTRAAAKGIRGSLRPGQRDPYHLAAATQSFLRGDPFSYTVDIRGECRAGEPVTECLLRTHAGFCQQYATTMVVILRELGVPARYVEGWLPGRDLGGGQWEVDANAAHAWVEVWFDGIGWLPFDPTPGDASLTGVGQAPTVLPRGEDLGDPGPGSTGSPDDTAAPPTIEPLASGSPFDTLEPSPSPDIAGLTTSDAGDPPLVLLLAAVLTGVALAAAGGFWVWSRRYPGHEPELVWRGITGLAARLGTAPRASQTPYEYTVTLSAVVPRAARDLRTVADAKVDATYGPPRQRPAAWQGLRDAYRRARVGLLRLLLRRR